MILYFDGRIIIPLAVDTNTYFVLLLSPWLCCLKRSEIRVRIRKSILRKVSRFVKVDSLYQDASNDYYCSRFHCKRSFKIQKCARIQEDVDHNKLSQPHLHKYIDSDNKELPNLVLPGAVEYSWRFVGWANCKISLSRISQNVLMIIISMIAMQRRFGGSCNEAATNVQLFSNEMLVYSFWAIE